jgi:ribA/ribD-fused uncharacterized protein
VIEGNMMKFEQNPDLLQLLLKTGNSVILNSTWDDIWGVGQCENSRLCKPELWSGLNLLGFCLMEVRERLREKNNK